MKRVFSRRGVLAVLVILASLIFIFQSRVRSLLDTTPPSLTDIQTVDILREQFNQDVGRPRLILLVSPT